MRTSTLRSNRNCRTQLWNLISTIKNLITNWKLFIGQSKNCLHQKVFWRLQEIGRGNPKLGAAEVFFKRYGQNYIASTAMSVRRIIDNNRDSVSLRRFLKAVRDNPKVISRSRYLSYDPNQDEQFANGCFDKLVGTGRDNIDVRTIDADDFELIKVRDSLSEYTDRRIAHFDKRSPSTIPRLGDLDDATDALERVLKTHLNLFRGVYPGVHDSRNHL